MTQNTSDEERILAEFNAALDRGSAQPHAVWRNRITRADGGVEESFIPENVVTKEGLKALASLGFGVSGANSPAAYLAIGTVTAAHSLGSSVTGFGEVSRKVPSIKASSYEVMIMAMTWAGAADGLTGVALASGGMVNHASSGLGIAFNLTNSVNATLQNSDFLLLQCEVQIGSYDNALG
jgi:hypothetical protein